MSSVDAGTGHAAPPHASRRRLPAWLRYVLAAVIVGASIWFLVVPQFSDVEESFAALDHLSVPLVVAAFVLEILSLLSYSALTGVMLGWGRIRYRTLVRIDLADLAVNHTAPGGGAVAGAVRFRLFRDQGISEGDAAVAATVEIILSNLALVVLFLVGVALSLTQVEADPKNYIVAGVVVLVLLVGIAAVVWALILRTAKVVSFARTVGRRVPFLGEERSGRLVESFASSLRHLGQDRRRLWSAVATAVGNWLFDAAALWVMLAALGQPIGPGPLLTVYGVGTLLTFLPLTPGGLGIVEGVMVPALIGFGVPHSAALLGVIGWRLFEYWLPIPVGGIAYASLRFGGRSRKG
jgi:uncharacterized protein (TIRG00374 family)